MLDLYIIWLHAFQFFIFEISTNKAVSIYLAAIFVTSVSKLSRSRGAVSCQGPAARTKYSVASGCRIECKSFIFQGLFRPFLFLLLF